MKRSRTRHVARRHLNAARRDQGLIQYGLRVERGAYAIKWGPHTVWQIIGRDIIISQAEPSMVEISATAIADLDKVRP
jgi:hypothetical protein